jgi:transporter family-2 protein
VQHPRQERLVALLAAVGVGVVVAVQARVNGDLAVALGGGMSGGTQAALVSFLVGFLAVTVIVLSGPVMRQAVRDLPATLRSGELTWWQCLGGLGGAFLILTQAASVPVLGVAVFTVAVVGGQTATGLGVDRVGLGPGGRQEVTARRLVASLVTVGSVLLAVSGRLDTAGFSLPLVLMCFLAGGAVSVQSALNGQVGRASGSALAASWLSFATGTVALALALVATVAGGHPLRPLPSEWWMYVGGLMGALFVTVVAAVVGTIGVLLVTLATVAGQLVGAVLLDAFFPVGGATIGATTLLGTVLTLAALAYGSAPRRTREGTP